MKTYPISTSVEKREYRVENVGKGMCEESISVSGMVTRFQVC